MTPDQLQQMARQEVANLTQNRINLAPEVLKVPTANYYDPERWQREIDQVFKRVPLALGVSSEFANPGAYRALKVTGVPVIMVRADDGVMRAFVNMCSHRGNYVVAEGSGDAKSFRCNYHAWNYNLSGDLINVLDESNFGEIDKGCMGLTELPCQERAGLVWVTLDPSSELDLDTFLNGYDGMLQHLGIDATHVVGRQEVPGPNWKVAYDGYRDFYHLPILHKDTIGAELSHQPDYFAWGPHVRVVSPKNFSELAEKDEALWTEAEMAQGVWTIFPNISIAGGAHRGGFYMISQLYPGTTPGTSTTTQTFLAFDEPAAVDPKALQDYMGLMQHVVANEDYFTGFNVQAALATGAKEFSYFGRNEGGGQLFHQWLDALLDTQDEALNQLFRDGLANT